MKTFVMIFILFATKLMHAQDSSFYHLQLQTGLNYTLDKLGSDYYHRLNTPGFETTLQTIFKFKLPLSLEFSYALNTLNIDEMNKLNEFDSTVIIGKFHTYHLNIGTVLMLSKNKHYAQFGLSAGAGMRTYPEEIYYDFTLGQDPEIFQGYPANTFDVNLKMYAGYSYQVVNNLLLGLAMNVKIERPLSERTAKYYSQYDEDIYELNESDFISFSPVITITYLLPK